MTTEARVRCYQAWTWLLTLVVLALLGLPWAMAATHNVVTAKDTVLQNSVSATGNGTVMSVGGLPYVAVQVTGTFTGTVTFQGTLDGTTWVSVPLAPVGGGAGVSSTTAPGIWVGGIAGLDQLRAPVTWTSGTSVKVIAKATLSPGVLPAGSTAVTGTVTANAGTGVFTTTLPVAAALSDAAANATAPTLGTSLLAYNGATWDRVRVPAVFKDENAVAIGTITTVWTPASGKRIRLMGGTISVSTAVSVLFEDNAGGTTVTRTPKLGADTPYVFELGNGRLLAAGDNVLKATSSASASLTGTLWGTEE